ncbi:hypothetical protein ACOSP7_006712 [Xanthoceras sorbifolium]|uniref:ENTH domain-containing protein n=1 Tax=Xanthoceras sorbifolium TaxID=99658 RepID=A0ABQ8I998_9ROSI|nr:hypothetical protein JRO89_XS03G0091200 [Xanthoceras sorbifolium]
MGTLFLNQIKKQASFFLQNKYKTARLAFTDVTQAELLAEEATKNDPWGPDAKTMTQIAEASFDVDDYWRIVDVLHRRLYSVDWKQWRISYKSLVLLEFLLTHGPEDFAEEFQCDIDVIQQLGTFQHIDEKGFNWGANMQRRSDHILALLRGGTALREARLKAIKITKEIRGFGNSLESPVSSSPCSSSSSSETSRSTGSSSFSSYTSTNWTWNDHMNNLNKSEQQASPLGNYSEGGIREENNNIYKAIMNNDVEGPRLWDCPPIQEAGSLIDSEENEDHDEYAQTTDGVMDSICSKFGLSPSKKINGDKVPFRSFSNVERGVKKRSGRQSSLGY